MIDELIQTMIRKYREECAEYLSEGPEMEIASFSVQSVRNSVINKR